MNFHQNPSMLTNVFKLQISPMRRPSKSDSPKCLKYQNVPYICNFWDIGKPWKRFQCWVRIIYFLTVPDDHTVVYQSVLFCTHFPSLFVFMYIFFFVFMLFICEHCLFVLIFIDCFFPLDPAPGDWQFVCCSLFLSYIFCVCFLLFVFHPFFVCFNIVCLHLTLHQGIGTSNGHTLRANWGKFDIRNL